MHRKRLLQHKTGGGDRARPSSSAVQPRSGYPECRPHPIVHRRRDANERVPESQQLFLAAGIPSDGKEENSAAEEDLVLLPAPRTVVEINHARQERRRSVNGTPACIVVFYVQVLVFQPDPDLGARWTEAIDRRNTSNAGFGLEACGLRGCESYRNTTYSVWVSLKSK